MVALVTLFAIQGALGWLRQYSWADRLVNRSPVLLMVGEQMLSAEPGPNRLGRLSESLPSSPPAAATPLPL